MVTITQLPTDSQEEPYISWIVTIYVAHPVRMMFDRELKRFFLLFSLGLAFFCFALLKPGASMQSQYGELINLSGPLVADAQGKLILAYVAGEAGLPQGSRLRIQLPAGWYNIHGCPRVDDILKYQDKDPSGQGYFGLHKARSGIKVKTLHWNKEDMEGVSNRFVQTLGFEINGADMKSGERLELVFQARVKDARAYVPVIGGSGPILSGVILPGEDTGRALPVLHLAVKSGSANELWLALPSVAAVGERLHLKLSLVDSHYNPCRHWTGTIRVQRSEGFLGLPEFIELKDTDQGHRIVEIQAKKAGTFFIQARAMGVGEAISNPVRISESPKARIFWGDIHSHSQRSHDGMGIEPFAYARDITALDFYANTEHVRAITQAEWQAIQEDVRGYNQPGRFVTILAFENSTLGPSGHHNIYFPGDNAPLAVTDNLAESWDRFSEFNPLMIQHHTGIGWILGPPIPSFFFEGFNRVFRTAANWDKYQDVFRPAMEIYSLHGSSELYDPEDHLAYENCDLTLPHGKSLGPCNTGISMRGNHYARDAWAQGLMLGVVGGSDDHRAQPGKPGGSLTAVITEDLSRESIIQAIHDRRTYATTGDRIYLDFRINDAPMGAVISSQGPPRIRVHAIGTDSISLLQVMRYDRNSGVWQAAIEERPHLREVELERTDQAASGEALYYLRLEQSNLNHERPVRAWSSPIWVKKK